MRRRWTGGSFCEVRSLKKSKLSMQKQFFQQKKNSIQICDNNSQFTMSRDLILLSAHVKLDDELLNSSCELSSKSENIKLNCDNISIDSSNVLNNESGEDIETKKDEFQSTSKKNSCHEQSNNAKKSVWWKNCLKTGTFSYLDRHQESSLKFIKNNFLNSGFYADSAVDSQEVLSNLNFKATDFDDEKVSIDDSLIEC